MEYILMAVFGGGTADWQMIEETNYDWKDIMYNIQSKFEIENIGFNDFIVEIFDMAKEDFATMIDRYIAYCITYLGINKENEQIINKLKKYDFRDEDHWDMWANCLDNHIQLFVEDEEMKNLLENIFKDEISEINNNIGFTEIEIEVE